MPSVPPARSAPAHFRNAHLADGRAAGRRRTGQRREDRTGAQVGHHQAARHAIEPAVERLVQILAGRRGTDRRAHHHEHRDGDQGKFIEARPEGFGNHMDGVETLKQHQKRQRDGAEAEGHRNSRQQHQQRNDEDERPLKSWAHGASPNASRAWARAKSSALTFSDSPNGEVRPVTREINSTRYCNVSRPRPTGIDK
jgi:hypothetical protein